MRPKLQRSENPVGATTLFLLMFDGFVFELCQRRDSNTKQRSSYVPGGQPLHYIYAPDE